MKREFLMGKKDALTILNLFSLSYSIYRHEYPFIIEFVIRNWETIPITDTCKHWHCRTSDLGYIATAFAHRQFLSLVFPNKCDWHYKLLLFSSKVTVTTIPGN